MVIVGDGYMAIVGDDYMLLVIVGDDYNICSLLVMIIIYAHCW